MVATCSYRKGVEIFIFNGLIFERKTRREITQQDWYKYEYSIDSMSNDELESIKDVLAPEYRIWKPLIEARRKVGCDSGRFISNT